jgi:lysophospholipase L1-like esterase
VTVGGGRVLRYVALGDSYTIGTATRSPDERWPDQLIARLARSPSPSTHLQLVANLGVNGFTSRDLIEVELPQLDSLRPEFATVLIGVNDVVQGVPEATYRENVSAILDELLGRLPPTRLVVVTTPDYTVTPRGGDYGDPAGQAGAIRRFNSAISEHSAQRGIAVIDIHAISIEAANDPTLVADDGLHPSGVQYGRWVDRIAPIVTELLRD